VHFSDVTYFNAICYTNYGAHLADTVTGGPTLIDLNYLLLGRLSTTDMADFTDKTRTPLQSVLSAIFVVASPCSHMSKNALSPQSRTSH
jgi:hypothetical protein